MGKYFLMPKLDMSMSEGTIVNWLKNEGDYIALGASALEVETGKVSIEVDNTIASGNILARYYESGDTVAVNTPIAYIGSPNESAPSPEAARSYGEALRAEADTESEPEAMQKQEYDFDIAIIGGGQAGYALARECANYGVRIAVIERGKAGGVCLHSGCIPTAALSREAKRVIYNKEEISLPSAYEAMRAASREIEKNMKRALSGIAEVIYGEAEIIASGAIRAGARHLSAKHIVLATGSSAVCDDIISDGSADIYRCEEILSSPPKGALVVYGGGIIACELSFLFSAFGSSVTLLCPKSRLLDFADKAASSETERILRGGGVNVVLNSPKPEIKEGFACFGETKINCQSLLLEGTRKANLPSTFDKIKTKNGYIVADEKLRTNISGVYAIGDCVGAANTARRASLEAELLAKALFGGKADFSLLKKPSAYCVHTFPEVAFIGESQNRLEEKATACRIGKRRLRNLPAAIARGETSGIIKLLADERYGEILGAVIAAPNADELIGIVSTAIMCENTIEDLAENAFLHPSYSEAIGETARMML